MTGRFVRFICVVFKNKDGSSCCHCYSDRRLFIGLARAVCQQRKPMVNMATVRVRARERAKTDQPMGIR